MTKTFYSSLMILIFVFPLTGRAQLPAVDAEGICRCGYVQAGNIVDAGSLIKKGNCIIMKLDALKRYRDLMDEYKVPEPFPASIGGYAMCVQTMDALCTIKCDNLQADLINDAGMYIDRNANYPHWECHVINSRTKRKWFNKEVIREVVRVISPFGLDITDPEKYWGRGSKVKEYLSALLAPSLDPALEYAPGPKDNFADDLYKGPTYVVHFTQDSAEFIEQAAKTTAIGTATLVAATILYRIFDYLTGGAVTTSSFIIMEDGNKMISPNIMGGQKDPKQTASVDGVDLKEYCEDLDTNEPVCDLPDMGTYAIKLGEDKESLLLSPIDGIGPNS